MIEPKFKANDLMETGFGKLCCADQQIPILLHCHFAFLFLCASRETRFTAKQDKPKQTNKKD